MAIRLWCCALILAVSALLPAAHAAERVGAVSVDGRGLPLVLSAADAERYRKIFALQDAGRMGEADDLIFQLQDQRLWATCWRSAISIRAPGRASRRCATAPQRCESSINSPLFSIG